MHTCAIHMDTPSLGASAIEENFFTETVVLRVAGRALDTVED